MLAKCETSLVDRNFRGTAETVAAQPGRIESAKSGRRNSRVTDHSETAAGYTDAGRTTLSTPALTVSTDPAEALGIDIGLSKLDRTPALGENLGYASLPHSRGDKLSFFSALAGRMNVRDADNA
jgi:hypothetical protein